MKTKYKWTCENCGQTLITFEARTPVADGCPEGYDLQCGIPGEHVIVYKHVWHGEQVDEK